MSKKLLCILLATFLLFGAVGCDLEPPQEEASVAVTTTTEGTTTATEATTTTTEVTTTTTEVTTTTTEAATTTKITTKAPTTTVKAVEATVWIPQSGSKYHRRPNCSNMKNPSEVSLSYAKSHGYTPCEKCY